MHPGLAPVAVATLGIGVLTVMDGLVKHVSALHATPQVVLLRFLFGAAAAALVFAAVRPPLPRGEALRAHLARSLVIVVTASAFFYALATLPFAVTLALSFTAPLFIALFAGVTLGERPGAAVWAALALGFGGVLVVLSGEIARGGGANWPGIVAALGSAVSYAVVMVMLKSRAARDPLPTIVLLQNILPAAFTAPVAVTVWTPPTLASLALFGLIGVLGTAGHLAMAWAYGRADASRLGALEYTSFVWAAAIGLAVFGEVPSPATIAGTALIVAGAVLAARSASG